MQGTQFLSGFAAGGRQLRVKVPDALTVLLLFVAALPAASEPMTFFLAGNGGNCVGCEWVAAEGEITSDTPNDFQQYIERNGRPYHISLHSPGGNLIAGIELGEMIRAVGASTLIGETIPMGEEYGSAMVTKPGVCASACAFAFMGGTERFVGEDDQLGVHQFYAPKGSTITSDVVQALVGYSLIHVLRMGIDAGVIIAASGTAHNDVHWFSREELVLFGLDTSGTYAEPWALEPFGNGVVLTTRVHSSTRRSVAVTVFCRAQSRRWHLLISEPHKNQLSRLQARDIFDFSGAYPSEPQLSLGTQTYRIASKDVEFLRISGDQIYLSINLPHNLHRFAGQEIVFYPDLARAFGNLLSATVDLPSSDWLAITEGNCI